MNLCASLSKGFMLTRRILGRLLVRAINFAVEGAVGLAITLAVQGAFIGTLAAIVVALYPGNDFSAVIFVLGFCILGGAVIGLTWGGLAFFAIGLCRGTLSDSAAGEDAARRQRAACVAGVRCGWATALSAAIGLGLLRQRQLGSASGGTSVFPWRYLLPDLVGPSIGCLIAGSLFGCILGALCPGTVERAQEFIKSSFSFARRT